MTDWGACAHSGRGGTRQPRLGCMHSLCWDPPLVPMAAEDSRLGCTRSDGSPSQYPQRQGLVCGERVCDDSPAPCTPLNNGASLLRQTTLPPGAFPALEVLTSVSSGCPRAANLIIPIPSGCLHEANSCPLPRTTLLTPHFSTQPLPALADTHLKLGCLG